MIDYPNKLIFVHIPKCGGTSIANAYATKHEYLKNVRFMSWISGLKTSHLRVWKDRGTFEVQNQHATYDQYAFTFPDYRYVTQVRNPYARFESAYRHLRELNLVTAEFKDWHEQTLESILYGDWVSTLDNSQAVYDMNLMRGSFDISMVFKPQWHWIREEVEVYKLEDKSLWKELRLKETHENKGRKYEVEWSESGRSLAYRVYKKDFERLQYSR